MNYKKQYYITHPREFIEECVHGVRYFIQRGSRGYSEQDVWNLGSYLSSWLPKALRELKKSNSYTSSFDGWCKSMTQNEWRLLLEQMAQGFEEINIKGTRDFPKRWLKANLKKRRQRKLFAFWFTNLWG